MTEKQRQKLMEITDAYDRQLSHADWKPSRWDMKQLIKKVRDVAQQGMAS